MNLDIVKVKSLKHTLKIFKYFLKNLEGETFIIVPDKLSLFMERFLFESTDMEASFDIQVVTMNRFCKSLLNDLNVEYKTISRIGSIMLTSKSIDETKPEYLSQYSSFSYASEIFNTISQIKSSNIEYNSLTNLNLSKNLSNKIKDLSKIYACYENKKAGYIDSSDIINLACMNMCNAKLINSNFMFLGFVSGFGYFFGLYYALADQDNAPRNVAVNEALTGVAALFIPFSVGYLASHYSYFVGFLFMMIVSLICYIVAIVIMYNKRKAEVLFKEKLNNDEKIENRIIKQSNMQ